MRVSRLKLAARGHRSSHRSSVRVLWRSWPNTCGIPQNYHNTSHSLQIHDIPLMNSKNGHSSNSKTSLISADVIARPDPQTPNSRTSKGPTKESFAQHGQRNGDLAGARRSAVFERRTGPQRCGARRTGQDPLARGERARCPARVGARAEREAHQLPSLRRSLRGRRRVVLPCRFAQQIRP